LHERVMILKQRTVTGVRIGQEHGARQMLRERVRILDRDHLIEDAVHDQARLRDSAELREALPAVAALPRAERGELRGRDVRTRQRLAILPRPAFSNRVTSRPRAIGSVTAGSQKSSVPVKCCKQRSGGADPRPKRRYAYVSTPVATNCVGAVMLLAWAWVSVATLATYAVRSDLKPARSSATNVSGCSHAAKCPPLGSRL